MGKLTRNAVGGCLAIAGVFVLTFLGMDSLVLVGWFGYCAAIGYGANRAHGDANAAAIAAGLEKSKA